MGLTQQHKRGTGKNKGTPHKRELAICHNVTGRPNIVNSELAPPADLLNTKSPRPTQSSASVAKVVGSTLFVAPSPHGTVMSYVFTKNVLLELLGKTLTPTSSTITNEATQTIAQTCPTGRTLTAPLNDIIQQETIVVEDQETLLPVVVRNFENVQCTKLSINAFDQTDSGQERTPITSRKAKS